MPSNMTDSGVNGTMPPTKAYADNKVRCFDLLAADEGVIQPPLPPPPSEGALWTEDFDEVAVGTELTAMGFDNSGAEVSNEQANTGLNSARHDLEGGASSSLSYGCSRDLATHLVQGDEFWIQAKFYYPLDWDFGNAGDASIGGSNERSKFFRLHTETPSGANAGYNDTYLYKKNETDTQWNWIKEGVNEWAFDGAGAENAGRPLPPNKTGITRGQWSTVEYYIKLHSIGDQARVRCWVDGILEFEVDDLATLNDPTHVADRWHFCTYYNGGGPKDQHMYTDDWAVYTSASPPENLDIGGNIFIGGGA
jgi:hypothetical protein